MQGLLSFGKSIREFKRSSEEQTFPEAVTYPSFFDKHLVHPGRKIKALLNDPNANIRVFYFQYLMLCFEIENQNYEFYISKIQKFLLDPNFTFLFLLEDDQKLFNDKQFKRFLLEFMEILDSGQFETTEAALNAYPIADTVFIYFFRTLAIYAEITTDFDSYIDKNILFGFLLENFNIDAQMFEDKCIKFIEAEVFVYEESPTEVYLVYKDIDQSIGEERKSIGSMVDSKKGQNHLEQPEQEGQIQQNISMLDEEEKKSNSNSNSGGVESGFKKNKIVDTDEAYKKIANDFEQKPSVFSCNDQPLEGQLQSQVIIDDHHGNKQGIEYSFKASQHDSHILNPSQESKHEPIHIHNQYGLHHNTLSSSRTHKQDKHSHIASVTTGHDYGYDAHSYGHRMDNHSTQQEVKNRDKNAYSHHTNLNPNPHTDNYGLGNNNWATSRNHSNTVVQKTNFHQPKPATPPSPYASPMPNNTHIHPQPYLPTTPTTATSATNNEKLHVLPEIHSYSTNKYQDYSHSYGSSTYVPATRDVPTHDHQSRHLQEGKGSAMTGNTSSRESLTHKELGRHEGQGKTSSYMDSLTTSIEPNPQPHHSRKSLMNPQPEIALYNPKQTGKSYQPTGRDLRLDSLQNGQKLREMIATKLSVSKQFTDSLTLMKMGEPYSTNIKRMKSRSREFRQSLIASFK